MNLITLQLFFDLFSSLLPWKEEYYEFTDFIVNTGINRLMAE